MSPAYSHQVKRDSAGALKLLHGLLWINTHRDEVLAPLHGVPGSYSLASGYRSDLTGFGALLSHTLGDSVDVSAGLVLESATHIWALCGRRRAGTCHSLLRRGG